MIIPFNVPYLAGNELHYLSQVVSSGFFSGNGPFTKKVQQFLEQRYKVPHVLLTHSCTAALEMTALLLDFSPADEVILPSYTFVSTASAFLRAGAKLVFCEVDPHTMNIDPRDAATRITSRTKAIVAVHYGGIGADMNALSDIAKSRGIAILEDAAQGLDAKQQGRWLGTLSPLASLSFHETKNLHCGLGGALFINEPHYFDRAENIWERGTNRSKVFKGLVDKYSWVELGSSFYPSELQAAFLLAQLESIDENRAVRAHVFRLYEERLARMVELKYFSFPYYPPLTEMNFHSVFIICNSGNSCDSLRMHLKERGVNAYIGYVPLHSSQMGKKLGYAPNDLPVTVEFAERVLRLPFHHEMKEEQVEYVCNNIKEYFSTTSSEKFAQS